MDAVIEALKAYLLPGSTFFLLVATTLAAFLLEGRTASNWSWARRGLWLLVALYWGLSVPFVALALEEGLAGEMPSIVQPQDAAGVSVLVVLGGGAAQWEREGHRIRTLSGASALRALEAARLFRGLEPDLVIVSGGGGEGGSRGLESEALRDVLVALGVPEEVVLLESSSQSTYEQALFVKPILEENGADSVILVTSRAHMRRAKAVFEAQGIRVVPAPAREESGTAFRSIPVFLPSPAGLSASQAALREYLALGYYWARGWLTTP